MSHDLLRQQSHAAEGQTPFTVWRTYKTIIVDLGCKVSVVEIIILMRNVQWRIAAEVTATFMHGPALVLYGSSTNEN